MFFRYSVRYIDLELMPVLVFCISHTFHLFRIVRILIDGRHRPDLVESLYQHSFVIHIGKSHRPLQCLHALSYRPFFYSTEQGIHHFGIVNEVYEPETCIFLVPCLVAPAVDHSCDASHNLSVFVC